MVKTSADLPLTDGEYALGDLAGAAPSGEPATSHAGTRAQQVSRSFRDETEFALSRNVRPDRIEALRGRVGEYVAAQTEFGDVLLDLNVPDRSIGARPCPGRAELLGAAFGLFRKAPFRSHLPFPDPKDASRQIDVCVFAFTPKYLYSVVADDFQPYSIDVRDVRSRSDGMIADFVQSRLVEMFGTVTAYGLARKSDTSFPLFKREWGEAVRSGTAVPASVPALGTRKPETGAKAAGSGSRRRIRSITETR
jgi:hypothetical protein